MKFSKLTAAILAAAIVVTPLSVKSPDFLTPSTAFAEGTGASAALPDWIPTDFDSAIYFRNTYGATHIDNGLSSDIRMETIHVSLRNTADIMVG
ncbi:hypothetical protein [Ruminococcus flavefaciens]|uniref:hypothetical protein n=1 Tax=Ruminococcus flavefaciens TaxID=1265 RepID=UPI00048E3476|nr:hypothetical protein [Ruminococcus flavefaciens]